MTKEEKRKAYMKAYQKVYRQTPEGKANAKARQQTQEYKAYHNTYQKVYRQTPEGKEDHKWSEYKYRRTKRFQEKVL